MRLEFNQFNKQHSPFLSALYKALSAASISISFECLPTGTMLEILGQPPRLNVT